AQRPAVGGLKAQEGLGPAKRAVAEEGSLPEQEDTLRGFDSSVIEAIVPEEQVVVSGEELRIELAQDIEAGGKRVAAGTPVFGLVQLSGERLVVKITVLASEGHVYPVNLSVHDEDGLP